MTRRILCVPLLLFGAVPAAAAQAPADSRHALAGRVLDATSEQPVAAAVVTLEPLPGGLLGDPRGRGPLAPVRSVATGEDGGYRFPGVTPGRYRLRYERLGYRGATLEVEVRGGGAAGVSVGLELEPVELQRVLVRERAAPPFRRATNSRLEPEEARARSERLRQHLFVSPDARVLTYADVQDGVTLGEGDIFRALQRFPGVGTRDDYTAELWTRGAPWAHTRVTFDGIPLLNPLHAVGVLSALTPEVLGAVHFHPGARPASVAGGAAGVVELRTRPALGDGAIRGLLDLSMAGAQVALEQRVGEGGWLLAGRRSHLDVLEGGLGWLGLDTLRLPYVFHDLAGRADLALGGARVEASGLWERDRLFGDLDGVLERTEAGWGNAAARVTVRARLGGLELAQSLGGSSFDATSDARLVRTREPAPPWTEPASENRMRHFQLAGEVAPSGGGPAPWAAGWDVVAQDGHYDGPVPRYHAVRPDTVERLVLRPELRVAGAWLDLRRSLAGRLTLNPGLRIETGDRVAGAPAVRLAPRLAVRWTTSPDGSVSLALGRSWQYLQAIALAGPSIHPAFHAAHFWVLADERAPAIRSDLVSLGGERWLGSGWLASATVYARHATGVTVPDPTPGFLTRPSLFVVGENDARGVEAGLRRIGARWSLSLGWSFALSELEAGGYRYPAPADRRHVLDATAALRLPAGLRLSVAYTGMSGAPFTRAVSRSPQDCELFGFGCGGSQALLEEPNAERTPAYHGLDASLHWSRPVGVLELSAYLQLRNLLDRENAVTYAGTLPLAVRDGRSGREVVWDDRLERGLPRLPLLGLRVAF